MTQFLNNIFHLFHKAKQDRNQQSISQFVLFQTFHVLSVFRFMLSKCHVMQILLSLFLKYGKAAHNAMCRNAHVQKQWCQK
jgi:hypothetical protein